MKKLAFGIGIIVFIVLVLFAAFFTPYGSNIVLKPIANKILAKKVQKPKITITKIDSKINSLNLEAKIAQTIDFTAFGNINYFQKSFDLEYKVDAKELLFEKKVLPLHLNVKGKAVGDIEKFGVNGKGSAFESDISYSFIVDKKELKSIRAHLNAAQLVEVFQIASLPPLMDGLLFVDIQMPSLDIKNPKGYAKIAIKDGRFNRRVIAKKFNILLPKDEKFNLSFFAKVDKKLIKAKGECNSTSAKITLKKVLSTLNFKKIKGYFTIVFPDLKRLQTLTKQSLQGSLKANGAFYANLSKKYYQVVLKSKSLGGITSIKASTNKAKAKLKSVSIPKILYMLKQKRYISKGILSADIDIKNIKKLQGSFLLNSNGIINKKFLKTSLPGYKYYFFTKGNINDTKVFAKKTILKSAFAKVVLHDTKYSLLTKTIQTPFALQIANLKALQKISKTPLQGALSLKGFLKQRGKYLNLKASTNSLGGLLNIALDGKRAKIVFKKLSLPKLLYMLNQPPYFKNGLAYGKFDFSNIALPKGVGDIKLSAILNEKTLQKYKLSLPKGVKFKLQAKDILFANNKVKFNASLSSTLADLLLQKGTFNLLTKEFKSNYKVSFFDLSALKPLIKQDLRGSLELKGVFSQHKNTLFLSGITNIAKGTVEFNLKNNLLSVNGAGLSIVDILYMLKKDRIIDGIAKVLLHYNLKSQKGDFRIDFNEARFLNSKLVHLLKQYANFDLAQEIFHEGVIDGTINKNIIFFNVNTNSKRVKILIHNGEIDTKAQTINAKVTINYKGKDYNFIVKGPLQNPRYKISFSGALKEKVIEKLLQSKKIKKLIPKDLLNQKEQKTNIKEKIEEKVEKKIDKVVPKEVKGLLKGLFH